MKLLPLACALSAALFAAPAAFAAPVTYDISGIVEGTSGAYADIPYYSEVTIELTENVALARGVNVQPNFVAYFYELASSDPLFVTGSFNLDDNIFGYSPGPYSSVNDMISSTGPIARGQPYVSSYVAGSGIFFANGNFEGIQYDATSTSADQYSLTGAVPKFLSDDSGTLTIHHNVGGVNSQLDLNVTGVKEVNVPAPAAWGLLLVGIAGAFRKRKIA